MTAGSARGLLRGQFLDDDRLLVLGAGGWLGSTMLDLVDPLLERSRVLAVASRARTHALGRDPWMLHEWSELQVQRFAPTIVLNLAFLTRGLAATMPTGTYVAQNWLLIERFLRAVAHPNTRLALTISSGAAVTETQHPYGQLKREEELAALAHVAAQRTIVAGRAYSISGPFVRNPADYAFSSFAAQAATGVVVVNAERPTFRRYCDAGEFLAVCMRRGLDGYSGVLESGGELVEMRDLAGRMARAAGPNVIVSESQHNSDIPSVYASDDRDWQSANAHLGFMPMNLDAQISVAVRRATAVTRTPQ